MVLPLDPREKLIVVPTRVFGPRGEVILRFMIDTGSTSSMISWDEAVKIGYDPDSIPAYMQITTASGVEYVSRLVIKRIEALRKERRDFPVLCHTLPPTTRVDGVLGLDYFQGHRLTIDFRLGLVTLD